MANRSRDGPNQPDGRPSRASRHDRHVLGWPLPSTNAPAPRTPRRRPRRRLLDGTGRVRTARWCSPISERTSSRSSLPEGDATRGWGPPWVGDEGDGDPDGGVLPVGQSQQAEHPARPQTARWRGGVPPPPRRRRCRRRELPDRAASPDWGSAMTSLRRSTRVSFTSRSRATARAAPMPSGRATTSSSRRSRA